MKKLICILPFLCCTLVGLTQERGVKSYSVSELFEMIESEADTIFKLRNAEIVLDSITDQRFKSIGWNDTIERPKIFVEKHILFENVLFRGANLKNIHFKKGVSIINSGVFGLYECQFDGIFKLVNEGDSILDIHEGIDHIFWQIKNCIFNNRLGISIEGSENIRIAFQFIENEINLKNATSDQLNISSSNIRVKKGFSTIQGNKINTSGKLISFYFNDVQSNILTLNEFVGKGILDLSLIANETLVIKKNIIEPVTILHIDVINENHEIHWSDFKQKVVSDGSINSRFTDLTREINSPEDVLAMFEELYDTEKIIKETRIRDLATYNNEISIRGKFYNYYKNAHNTVWANEVYTEIKDLETQRLAYLHSQNPSFKSYFTWKINQFLKAFSAYGTEPARAIVYSLYVILFFAFIYLFFPNSWDSHGKNRIIDRYTFFLKYMDRKAGIHEVYLEDKKADLLEYEEFKNIVESKLKRVPRIFTATALPLYKWAISGTKLSSSVLKRIDIIKGTWSDIPKKKRWWKSVLLTGAFGMAILYDLFIKMLNALMLSINTFTTLGFGEIPIRGLPRYLAIIEGFIGWFMLTIFSVSLISQLLN